MHESALTQIYDMIKNAVFVFLIWILWLLIYLMYFMTGVKLLPRAQESTQSWEAEMRWE